MPRCALPDPPIIFLYGLVWNLIKPGGPGVGLLGRPDCFVHSWATLNVQTKISRLVDHHREI